MANLNDWRQIVGWMISANLKLNSHASMFLLIVIKIKIWRHLLGWTSSENLSIFSILYPKNTALLHVRSVLCAVKTCIALKVWMVGNTISWMISANLKLYIFINFMYSLLLFYYNHAALSLEMHTVCPLSVCLDILSLFLPMSTYFLQRLMFKTRSVTWRDWQ